MVLRYEYAAYAPPVAQAFGFNAFVSAAPSLSKYCIVRPVGTNNLISRFPGLALFSMRPIAFNRAMRRCNVEGDPRLASCMASRTANGCPDRQCSASSFRSSSSLASRAGVDGDGRDLTPSTRRRKRRYDAAAADSFGGMVTPSLDVVRLTLHCEASRSAWQRPPRDLPQFTEGQNCGQMRPPQIRGAGTLHP